MKTAIIFASSHGTTEKAAKLLQDNLNGEVDLVDLKKTSDFNISGYQTIIIGTSIHAGSSQGKVKQFIKKNQQGLMTKRIGLFICCMFEGEKAEKQLEAAFPQELKQISKASGLFGGEFVFAKLNFLEKFIVKKVSGVTKDISTLNADTIRNFALKFNEIY